MPKDEEKEEGPYRPHSASPQLNAYHECVFECEDKESEKQNLMSGFPGKKFSFLFFTF